MTTIGRPRTTASQHDTRETYQEQQLRKEGDSRRALNRRVIRYVAGRAHDADDARLLLDALGLDPAEGRP